MRAMVLEAAGRPLQLVERETPKPAAGQMLVRVCACAVCRTDLHVVDGDLTEPKLPIVPGHEIVGRVVETGAGVDNFQEGDRVGIPGWATLAAPAPTAGRAAKTCAIRRVSPAIRSMAGSRLTAWRTPSTVFPFPTTTTISTPHRFFVPALSDTGR